ncbi:MAG: glutaredoxin domain-containing protein [Candidatus Paceibacterota bacterium]|jgi:glutaredoxin-like YruB-family protein|nr:glutaredoxin domain-containing protein [Candidatus Paceibacterota bacterium]MDD4831136.1 glutaredoxin domain-containing protein [Candidatus Paceibacterota bacterium]MDD4875114.1 glutaredoxin domain-containing protein [Candidatus Paceibacterota bacterium]
MENPRIRIFSTPSCPYCYTLKEFLAKKGFSFEDIDVGKDESARQLLLEKTGQMGVPAIAIGEEFIVGFEKKKICELLDIK